MSDSEKSTWSRPNLMKLRGYEFEEIVPFVADTYSMVDLLVLSGIFWAITYIVYLYRTRPYKHRLYELEEEIDG